ncbi:reverse transcriptase domain-containing protein [Citrus sinensis]|nr:reverse transcriptase domain-containing protein [Citrus sinensis]
MKYNPIFHFYDNEHVIVLIPKKSKPESLSDMRPIALCNVLYKIVAKMLSNRMKIVLGSVVSESQSAFIPGRAITDNILISSEIMHFLKRKRQGKVGATALKIDMSKAYDRIEWDFLEAMLLRLGFDGKWVTLIMLCVSTVRYHVIRDGKEIGPIVPSRGLHQGDPLSPYLFILCAEGLSALIRKNERAGLLHGVKVARGAPVVSHLFFADDCFLFFKATNSEAHVIKRILGVYGQGSGQMVNLSKSSIFFSSNVKEDVKEQLCHILAVNATANHGTYLGLPSFVGRNKKEVFSYIRDRVWQKLHSWSMNFSSGAGKEILLKTVAQAIPNYAMQVYLLPLDLCKDLETMMNSFWWGSRREGRGVWKLLTNPKSLIGQIFKARDFPRTSIVEAVLGHNPSFMWRSLLAAKHIIVRSSRIQVGSGQNTLIGSDPWLPDVDNGFISTSLNESLASAPVNSLMVPGQRRWDYEVVADLFDTRDRNLILQIPLSSRRDKDVWYWMADPHGLYTVRSCYRLLNNYVNAPSSGIWRKIWSLEVPSKVKVFLWRAAQNVLPTTDNLIWKRVEKSDVNNATCFQGCHGAICWTPPQLGWLKCNVDATTFSAQGKVSYGGLIRNSDGLFVAACCVSVLGSFGARDAEALGVCEILSWIKKRILSCVVVEMDCIQVFKAPTASYSCPNGYGLILDDCLALAKSIGDIEFTFVRRSANTAAHVTARVGGSLSGFEEWSHVPPPWLFTSL